MTRRLACLRSAIIPEWSQGSMLTELMMMEGHGRRLERRRRRLTTGPYPQVVVRRRHLLNLQYRLVAS